MIKKIFNINRYDMFWILVVWGVLAIWGFSSCESTSVLPMKEECTYFSKPPFRVASIKNPTEEELYFFKRDFGGDNLEVICEKVRD